MKGVSSGRASSPNVMLHRTFAEKNVSLQMFQANGRSFTVKPVSFHIMTGTSFPRSLLNDPVLQLEVFV